MGDSGGGDGDGGDGIGGDPSDAGSIGAVNGSDAASDATGMGDPTDAGSIGAVNGSDAASDASMGLADMGFNTDADVSVPDMVDPDYNPSKSIVSALLSHLGIPANIASVVTNQNNQSSIPTTLGTIGAILGGFPAAVGMGMIGSNIAANVPSMSSADVAAANQANADPSNGAGGFKMNMGDILGGLGSLYGYNQANSGLNQQINSLGNLYGQDSPYSQMLRQQLTRRDAAQGRRSQYGPREVELQAKLADLTSRNAPTLLQAQQAQQKLHAQGLASLYGLAQKTGLLSKIPSLGSIFGNSNQPNMSMGSLGDGGAQQSFGYGGNDYGNSGLNMGIGSPDMGNYDLGDYNLGYGG